MQGITSIRSSAVSRAQLNEILSDYLALDRARMFRRVLLKRFGLLALGSVAMAIAITGWPLLIRWIPVALFIAPPLVAWLAELRVEHRLSRRCEGVDVVVTHHLGHSSHS